MKRIFGLTGLLILGLIASQVFPNLVSEVPAWINTVRHFMTMVLLAYIMIEVGREFDLEGKKPREFGWDYVVAATAAAFPWIFCVIYFWFFLRPDTTHSGHSALSELLLACRFAAPTSAGVLFTMLAAAGLAHTWTFKKTRILAIFDDLDTVLLMIPLKVLMVGIVWQLGGILAIVTLLLLLGWGLFRKLDIPARWFHVLLYSIVITGAFELLYHYTLNPETKVGLQIEVLLPAFILGLTMKKHEAEEAIIPGEDAPGTSVEEQAGFLISCLFLFMVGFSMPPAFGKNAAVAIDISIPMLIVHVLAVTLIANLGKMFACLCYRKEASLRERLAVSVAMFPRGEVGAGVLALALGYGIKGTFVTVAFLSLALNLILTGFFIYVVKKLLSGDKAGKLNPTSIT